LLPTYLEILLRSKPVIDAIDASTFGAKMPRADWHFIGNMQTPLPPLPEQRAIVRYLDYVDRRIRRYVAAKRKLIGLLEEERQTVVNRAVTRGLDPNVRLKPSGVEWLGDVPEHWEVRRLKAVAQIRYGLGQPPPESPDGLPLIRATNVSRGVILEKDMLLVDPNGVPPSRDATLKEKEIVVVRSGAYTADSAIIPKEYAGSISGYDMVVRVTGAQPEYIALTLLATYVRDDQLIVASSRAAQPHLNAEELGNSVFLLPPLTEQVAIVEHLNQATADIDERVARARRHVELVEEYRTRLIADVVTGKLDVREAAAQLPDEAENDVPLGESGPQENGLAKGPYDAEKEPAIAEEVTT
jgi:type I restriction enzyme S subunit